MTSGPSSARRYWLEIAAPTLQEFADAPFDNRRAAFACLVLHHAPEHCLVERLGVAEGQRAQGSYWASRHEDEFKVVRAIAIALKHGERREDAYSLHQVYSRPPAVAGMLECGWSVVGDEDGSVLAQKEPAAGDLVDLHAAVAFVVNRLAADFPELGLTAGL